MGPFPHDAPKAKIDDVNIAGTDGFEFVEFAHPDPGKLEALFQRMGLSGSRPASGRRISRCTGRAGSTTL